MKNDEEIRSRVRERYGHIAKNGSDCGCSPVKPTCCCRGKSETEIQAEKIGYTDNERQSVPSEANLGLGCGNPGAIAALQTGEFVLDLGAGGGFDCFLASRKVGETGRVIGVDMTPDMVSRARTIAAREGYRNVEFRLGEIEHLPVADSLFDAVISNCVINLSPEKAQVYNEMFRVLKPGGRIALSDTVRLKDFPEAWKNNHDMLCSCVTGSASPTEIEEMLRSAGFIHIEVRLKPESREVIKSWLPNSGIEEYIASAEIIARKPI
ncbi:arsenite methyltransferase [bacterium]|nr:arsenite methyltransferase [bacterium]